MTDHAATMRRAADRLLDAPSSLRNVDARTFAGWLREAAQREEDYRSTHATEHDDGPAPGDEAYLATSMALSILGERESL